MTSKLELAKRLLDGVDKDSNSDFSILLDQLSEESEANQKGGSYPFEDIIDCFRILTGRNSKPIPPAQKRKINQLFENVLEWIKKNDPKPETVLSLISIFILVVQVNFYIL